MNTTLAQSLLECGVVPTPQRLAVYASLAGRCDHPGADVVFREVRRKLPTLSKTTVYSTLQLLARKGLVRCVHAEGDETRYDGNAAFHAHFRCRACGKVYDVFLPNPHRKPFVAVPDGFEADAEELTYYGTCSVCKNRDKKKGKAK